MEGSAWCYHRILWLGVSNSSPKQWKAEVQTVEVVVLKGIVEAFTIYIRCATRKLSCMVRLR